MKILLLPITVSDKNDMHTRMFPLMQKSIFNLMWVHFILKLAQIERIVKITSN